MSSFQWTAFALLAAENENPAAVPDVLLNSPDKLGPAQQVGLTVHPHVNPSALESLISPVTTISQSSGSSPNFLTVCYLVRDGLETE